MTDHPARPHTMDFDLTRDEAARRSQVVAALGDDWDPMAVLEGEREAARLLYSGLDEEQRAIYRDLVAAGVLSGDEPGDGQARAAD